ncbi:hypothetical protein [Vibrio jasicida]|uniref:hypothetical protein n=1 Tax=Vibrio jasicida TaxID=766224 RepID=UPI0003A515CA|nr:hypothetical protein [Vibrio jasicida]
MNNFKKVALASLVLAAIGTAQAADPQATVVWTGSIPSVQPGDTILITGLGGDLTAQSGALTPAADGTFTSETIVLESRLNAGSAETPEVGALQNANWQIASSTLTYGGVTNNAATLEVSIDGVVVTDDAAAAADANSIRLSVAQNSPLTDVGGDSVQAAVTVLASSM